MKFDHKTIQLPVHPGDPVYVIDSGKGWEVREETVKMVCITDDAFTIVTNPDMFETDLMEEEYFLTAEAAREEADKQRPEPPYPYAYDAKMWMNAKIWKPCASGWVYVRTKENTDPEYVTKAYYYAEKSGFYESNRSDAQKLDEVDAWMDAVYDLNDVLSAKNYEQA